MGKKLIRRGVLPFSPKWRFYYATPLRRFDKLLTFNLFLVLEVIGTYEENHNKVLLENKHRFEALYDIDDQKPENSTIQSGDILLVDLTFHYYTLDNAVIDSLIITSLPFHLEFYHHIELSQGRNLHKDLGGIII